MTEWLELLKTESTPSAEECFKVLTPSFPLLKRLKETPQDPRWHGEGDVFIHTSLVLKELYMLLDNKPSVTGERRQALILAAFFHDIAKPLCTREAELNQGMRIIAPRHEPKGRSYLCFPLKDLPLSTSVRRMILALVGEHIYPKRVVRSGEKGGFLRLQRTVDMELLWLLELADMKGRICEDRDENLEKMDLFRLYAHEYNCWKEDPYRGWEEYIRDHSGASGALLDFIMARAREDREAGRIYTPEEALARSYTLQNGFPEVIFLCGLSGSGKTHYIHSHLPGIPVISLDGIRKELYGKESCQGNSGQVIQAARERLKASLRKKERVAWDATNLKKDLRGKITSIVRDYNGLITFVFIYSSEKEAYQGNKNRERSVPDGILKRQIESFEYPLIEEYHRMIVADSRGETLWTEGFCSDFDRI